MNDPSIEINLVNKNILDSLHSSDDKVQVVQPAPVKIKRTLKLLTRNQRDSTFSEQPNNSKLGQESFLVESKVKSFLLPSTSANKKLKLISRGNSNVSQIILNQ